MHEDLKIVNEIEQEIENIDHTLNDVTDLALSITKKSEIFQQFAWDLQS